METKSSSMTGFSGNVLLKESLLFCGIFSSLFYVITDILASWCYEGYSYNDQFNSELLAIGLTGKVNGSVNVTIPCQRQPGQV
jgi:hypothetical protein